MEDSRNLLRESAEEFAIYEFDNGNAESRKLALAVAKAIFENDQHFYDSNLKREQLELEREKLKFEGEKLKLESEKLKLESEKLENEVSKQKKDQEDKKKRFWFDIGVEASKILIFAISTAVTVDLCCKSAIYEEKGIASSAFSKITMDLQKGFIKKLNRD